MSALLSFVMGELTIGMRHYFQFVVYVTMDTVPLVELSNNQKESD